MLFTPKECKRSLDCKRNDGQNIKGVRQMNILWRILDDKLNWHAHYEHLYGQKSLNVFNEATLLFLY